MLSSDSYSFYVNSRSLKDICVSTPSTEPPEPAPKASGPQRRSWLRRALPQAGAAVAALVAGLWLLACGGGHLARREATRLPHDSQSGVIIGAEAITLAPPAGVAPRATAILMLHGFVGSRSEFGELPERLAALGYTVRMVRLPGHGTQPMDLVDITTTTLMTHVESEYAALRTSHDQVAVVGFSMGASLATLLAAQQPVERLALCAPYFGVTYRWYAILSPERWQALLGPVVPWVPKPRMMVQLNRRDEIDQIQTYRVAPREGFVALMALGRAASQPATLAAVQCPVLCVASPTDGAASPARMRAAFDGLGTQAKQFVWLSEASNHQLFWDYDREAALQAVIDFFN